MCRVTSIVCLFKIIAMGVILKLATGFDLLDSELPKVSVKVSTSVVESENNNQQKAQINTAARQQRSSYPIAYDPQQLLLEPKKLQQFRTEDAVLPNQRPFGIRTEPTNGISYYNRQNDYSMIQQPSSSGRILYGGQLNYLKPTISTSYSISPLQSATTQEPYQQHKMIGRQTTNSVMLRDQARNTDSTGWRHDGQSNSQFNCHRRSLGRMLKGARSLLTDGFSSFQHYATSGNLMLGSSLLAAAIPLGALVLPLGDSRKRRAGLFTDEQSGGGLSRFSLQSRVDSMMGWIERSVEHLPNIPRLHPQECVKRSICEAHNDPNKYGAIGFMLRLLFPATNLSSTDRMDNMEYKVINKYRHAAGYGLNKRIDNNGTESPSVCKEKYEDCLVSLLDIGQNLMDLFLK